MSRPILAKGQTPITLVVVETIEEERAVLAELSELTVQTGTTVAPVLDRGELPARLEMVLSAAGSAVQALRRYEVAELRPTRVIAETDVARPDAVLAASGVDPDIVALAAALCGVSPGILADAPRSLRTLTADGRNHTALVLINPEKADLDSVVPPLVAMAEQRVHFGLLYSLDPVESRLAVLKSLLVSWLAGDGRASVLYADVDARAQDGPPMLQYAGTPEAQRRFISDQDVLVISGHANPLDAALGSDAALCARAGGEGPGSSRDFPCFNDGRCFRQPMMGRQTEDRAGLFGVDRTKARILVLAGCNVAALGRSWFDPRHSLAYQAQQQAGLACAVTASVAIGRLEFDLLTLALVAEGMPMGHAVAEINRVRTAIHHHANAYPQGVGPFVLLGNPCLELSGWDVQEVAGRPSGRRLAIDLGEVRFDRQHGALLRVRTPPLEGIPYLFLTECPPGVWCRGIWYPGVDRSVLYLWLGLQDNTLEGDGPLIVEAWEDDPSDMVVRAVEHCLRQVPFWTIALSTYRTRLGKASSPGDSLDLALAALPAVTNNFSQALVALTPARGVLTDEQTTRTIARSTWLAMADLDRSLLDCLIEAACRFGTLPLTGWEENLRRLDGFGPLSPCTCGSPVWGQRYDFPDGGSFGRSNYQCPLCGPIGEDDGRRLVHLTDLTRTVEKGAVITATASCSAPDNELVQVVAVVVLESLFRDRRMVGDVASTVVSPGCTESLTLRVEVPADLTQGAHPIAVLAIVNGASYSIRQMVQISTPARSAPS